MTRAKELRTFRSPGTLPISTVTSTIAEVSVAATHAAPAGDLSFPPEYSHERISELDRMVRGLAGRLHARLPRGCGIDVLDLVQAGNVGLLQAVRNFNPALGAPLAGFAKFRIRGEMLDMVRRHAGRSPGALAGVRGRGTREGEGDDWEARLPAGPENSPQHCFVERQRAEMIAQELSRLPPRYRLVVRLRYSREMTLQQIGVVLRINESRACQIHQNALRRLKRAFSNRGVRGLAQL